MVGNKPNPFPPPTHDTECGKRYGFVIERNCRAMLGFPGGSDGKESPCSAGDLGWIPGLGRSPREGNRNPLQYSCLENPMGGGAWQAIVNGVAKSQT